MGFAITPSSACPVCEHEAAIFDTGTVLGRYDATFRRCPRCGTIFADDPHWLAEAYLDSIALQDLGLPSRNVQLSHVTALLLRTAFPAAQRFLDYGAGNGMFVRLMRDAGFDFRYADPHGPNIFAAGHEAPLDGSSKFDLATAFEVLEHLRSPLTELQQMSALSPALFVTTTCLPDPAPLLSEWWYYGLDAGQHITFYTPRALDLLAERLGFRRTSRGSYHLLASRKVSSFALRVATSSRVSHHLYPIVRRRSLLERDYEELTGRRLR